MGMYYSSPLWEATLVGMYTFLSPLGGYPGGYVHLFLSLGGYPGGIIPSFSFWEATLVGYSPFSLWEATLVGILLLYSLSGRLPGWVYTLVIPLWEATLVGIYPEVYPGEEVSLKDWIKQGEKEEKRLKTSQNRRKGGEKEEKRPQNPPKTGEKKEKRG